MEEHRTTDALIIAEVKALREDFNAFKSEVNSRMAPLDKLKGFWSVLGFILGALMLIAGGITGITYLYHLIQAHLK